MVSRTVVITGGGTGIGSACAQLFAQQGDTVFVIGRRADPLEDVAKVSGAIPIVADVSTEEAWQQVILPRIFQHTSQIDVLICSAGGMGLGAADEVSDALWHQSMRVNLDSAFASVRGCLPSLIKQKGCVLFVGSIASFAAGPSSCAYVTAKHALIGLMRSVARDFGKNGVRSNVICPGWVRTPMADEEMQPLMAQHQMTLDEAYQYVCQDVPLQRPATANEVALACRFLCSTDALMISGAALVIDGGATVVDLPTLAFT